LIAPSTGEPDRPPSEAFQIPLKQFVILSPFGPRRRDFHTGIDLRGRKGGGDPVGASRAGRVIFARRAHGYGKMIVIQHADGYLTRYAHLKWIKVKVGEQVQALQEIGIVGATGRATTAHLHFEILTPARRFMDPAPWLFGKRKTA